MKDISKYLAVLVILVLVYWSWNGCSDNTSTTSGNYPVELDDVAKYFPIATGICLRYMEINNATGDTAYLRYGIGSPSLGANEVYPWYKNNSEYSYFSDTGYVYAAGNSVYYFEQAGDMHEKLLEAPFKIGKTWLRFNTSQVNNLGDSSFYWADDGNDDYWKYGGGNAGYGDSDDEEADDNDGSAAKSYPTVGANYFTLTNIENITLDNGNYFKDCLRIENNIAGRSNIYWYAPGTGLVKYVLGKDNITYPEGEIMGEITHKTVN